MRTLLTALLLLACPALAFSADPPKKKIVLIGMNRDHKPGDHEYMAGLAVLAESLGRTKGIEPVVIKDWPADPKVLDDAAAVVCYLGMGGKFLLQPKERRAKVEELMKKGTGFVAIHWAIESPKELGSPYMDILGGCYEKGFSRNPHNTTNVRPADSDHPIARGWQPFQIRDEFYYDIRLLPGAKPVLTAELLKDKDGTQSKDAVIGWTFIRKDSNGPLGPGRSFGFTGGHFLINFVVPEFRRFLINAILWTANIDVPEKGAPL